jgi:hypothetical protein
MVGDTDRDKAASGVLPWRQGATRHDRRRWTARVTLREECLMSTATSADSFPQGLLWAGWFITGLVVLFLIFDGGTKVAKIAPVLEACAKFGLSTRAVVGIGITLLVCTAVYAAPPTTVLGAILLTGYLGGAAATHVLGGSGVFEIAFAIGCGVLTWLGVILRDPRLLSMIVFRQ